MLSTSRVAQWKRAGPITQRSEDRNLALLNFADFFLTCVYKSGPVDLKHIQAVRLLHCPLMFAVKAKIYGVLYNQSSSIAFDETSSYWSAPKSS